MSTCKCFLLKPCSTFPWKNRSITLSHSCLKVHAGVPIALIIFAGPKGGRPRTGFSIFIRPSVRPYVRTYVRPSPRSNLDPYTFIKGQRENTGTKGQYRNKGTTKGQQRDNIGPKEQRNKGTQEHRNKGTKEQRNN